MKKIIELLIMVATVAVLALPAFANGISQPEAAAQDQCTLENKLAWYNEFRQHFKGDTAKANELAKKWLACPEQPNEEQQAAYLKNFVTLYEKATRKDRVSNLVYVKNDYPKAFELGRAVLAEEPENLKVLIDLAYAGYASKDPGFSAASLDLAQKAIRLIESGQTLESWLPYSSKSDTLGYLYHAIGTNNLAKDPATALKDLLKAAQFDGKIRKLPGTYDTIARAYEAGPYAKMASEYELKFKGKDESPESKLALENINQVIDRMIDAYARAVALAGNDAAEQANKKVWMDSLTTWYKYRNKSDVGITELIAGILSKPLPPEPTPLTTLPVSASGEGTSTTPGTTTASGMAPSGATTKPVTTGVPQNEMADKPAATTTSPSAGTPAPMKPAPKTSSAAKPRPKRNHRARG